MRVVIVGLDCLEPSLAFDRYAAEMPTLTRLRSEGCWGRLRSCTPPITVPAWSCMMSSQDPGQLGVYGFRNRKDHSYDKLGFALSSAIKKPRLWQILSQHNKRSVVIGVPQTYPPPKQLNGLLVAGFLTPTRDSSFTYPIGIKPTVNRVAGEGGYQLDVDDFRTDDKDRLLRDIHTMTEKRFRVIRHYMKSEDWDLLAFVEMGPDRLHHGFWRYSSTTHRLYQAGNPYENAIRDYYRKIDGYLAELLDGLESDDVVLVVSDHGARDMVGGICINEWLMQQGWLTLKARPTESTRFTPDLVDWSRTKAWGEGGYYGRLFINVEGREPNGQVPKSSYASFLAEVKAALEAIVDPEGKNIGTRVLNPHDVYKEVNNIAPDLMVFFGDLGWRSVGSVGMPGIHTFTNDTGPDDANHDWDGVFVMRDRQARPGEINGLSLFDVAPTVLDHLGLPVPDHMIGRPIGR